MLPLRVQYLLYQKIPELYKKKTKFSECNEEQRYMTGSILYNFRILVISLQYSLVYYDKRDFLMSFDFAACERVIFMEFSLLFIDWL